MAQRHVLHPYSFREAFRESVVDAVGKLFPIESGGKRVELLGATLDARGADDYRKQHDAKLNSGTHAVPLYGHVRVVDEATGKVLSESKQKLLAEIPYPTDRMTFIVGGSEYAGKLQTLLKSGPYTQMKVNGEAKTDFNLEKGQNFSLVVNPLTEHVRFEIAGATVTPHSFFRAVGIPEDQGRKIFGERLWAKNSRKSEAAVSNEIGKLYQKVFGKKGDPRHRITDLRRYFAEETQTREDTTKLLLGKAFTRANGEMIALSAQRTMDLVSGKIEPDLREELFFKRVVGPEDAVADSIANWKSFFQRKVSNRLRRTSDAATVVQAEDIGGRVRSLISGGQGLFERPEQYNQLQIFSSQMLTSPTGFGGITNLHQVQRPMRELYPSYFPFLDPTFSPEGERTGINQRVSFLSVKDGDTLRVPLYDRKEKRLRLLSPLDVVGEAVAPLDEADSLRGPFKHKHVRAMTSPDGLVFSEASKTRFVSPHMGASLTTSMIPLVQHTAPPRIVMAARHLEQAVPLKFREAPYVQARQPVPNPDKGELRGMDVFMGERASLRSPVDGTVTAVGEDTISIRTKDGQTRQVRMARYLPLNELKSHLTHTAAVKKGDTVTKGDLLADSQNTKDGVFALGRHLRTGIFPFRALNYEDGAVLSESAAKNMTSEHSYLKKLNTRSGVKFGRAAFQSMYPQLFSTKQLAKLDGHGVVHPGTIIEHGDPIAVALAPNEPTREHAILKGIKSSLVKPYKPETLTWDSPYPGRILDAVRDEKGVRVTVVTEEPIRVGDKVSNRASAKAIVTALIPDDEMPRAEDGKPLDIIYSPAGVVGRINAGFAYELLLGKAAKKNGAIYIVDNFSAGPDARVYKLTEVPGHKRRRPGDPTGEKVVEVKSHTRVTEHKINELVRQELEEADLKDYEQVFDPELGKHYMRPVLVGDSYWIKLTHQIDKKIQARGYGGSELEYDTSMVPKSGGKTGGQSLGFLGLYAMLGHGTSVGLNEGYTAKSNLQDSDWWTALMNGQPLPSPQVPFVMDRFHAYMKALRLDPQKEGNTLKFIPMTNEDIKALSRGELKNPDMALRGKNLKPHAGGLFDEQITGGLRGSGWAHMSLPEEVPNPLFERAIQSLLGITSTQYSDILRRKLHLTGDGELAEAPGPGRETGIEAVSRALRAIDVEKELAETKEDIKTSNKTKLDKHVKRYKFLRALSAHGRHPASIYLMRDIPVLPPVFRPVTELPDGSLNIGDTNNLYKTLGVVANEMKDWGDLPPAIRRKLYDRLRDSVISLYGLGGALNRGERADRGILQILGGVTSPKQGFIHDKLLARRMDMTARATITPDVTLGLDEIGIPEKLAYEMFRPLIVRDMVQRGYTAVDATKHVKERSSTARESLELIASKWLVRAKRDPVVHKYNILAGRPKLVPGHAIHINPLWTGPLDADFDGDSISQAFHKVVTLWDGSSATESLYFAEMIARLDAQGVQCKKRDGLTTRLVPPGALDVLAYDPATGLVRPFAVTEVQDHGELPEVCVKTRRGRELRVSEDASLCIFDPLMLEVRKARPDEVETGTCIPVAGSFSDPALDLVPYPPKVHALLVQHTVDRPDQTPIAATLGAHNGFVTRELAKRIIRRISRKRTPPTWLRIVDLSGTTWDPVESVEATGRKVPMFDLEVPGSWTFVLANGAVVWDSAVGPVVLADDQGTYVSDLATVAAAPPEAGRVINFSPKAKGFGDTSITSVTVHPKTDLWEVRTNHGRILEASADASLIGYHPFTLEYGRFRPRDANRIYVPMPQQIADDALRTGDVCGLTPDAALGQLLGEWIAGTAPVSDVFAKTAAAGRVPGVLNSSSEFRAAAINAAVSSSSIVVKGTLSIPCADQLTAQALLVLLLTFGISASAVGNSVRIYRGHVRRLEKLAEVPTEAFRSTDPDLVPFPKILAEMLEKRGEDFSRVRKWLKADLLPRRAALAVAKKYEKDLLWVGAVREDNWRAVESLSSTSSALPLGPNFLALVHARDLRWDRVRSTRYSRTADSFDITVGDAGSPTFFLAAGIPVQDTMMIEVPATDAAVVENRKLLPSNNLVHVASGTPMFTPGLDGNYGLFLLSQAPQGKEVARYKTLEEAEKDTETPFFATVNVGGRRTTRGRVAIYQAIPEALRAAHSGVLTDPKVEMTKGVMNALFLSVAKQAPQHYTEFADRMKELGFNAAQVAGASFGLQDLKAVPGVGPLLKKARADAIKATRGKSGPAASEAAQKIYAKTLDKAIGMAEEYGAKTGNRLYMMGKGGIKSWGQVRQFILPNIAMYSTGRVGVATPVTESYGEGLTGASWLAASAAGRSALIEKTQSVKDPGALTKELTASALDVRITDEDLGVRKPLFLGIAEAKDLEGRFTALPIKAGGTSLPKNTMLTLPLIRKLRASGVKQVPVRSPLYSNNLRGISQFDWGANRDGNMPEVGDYVGVMAAQALGERGVNLSMKQVHLAGAAGKGGSVLSGMDVVQKVLRMPAESPDYAVLAQKDGRVSNITDGAAGGKLVQIGDESVFVPTYKKLLVKRGQHVAKGAPVTDGILNPRDVLKLKGIDAAREQLVESVFGIYKSEGILRRNVETLVRAMTNSVRIMNPADSPFVRGEDVTETAVRKWSRDNPEAKAPVYEHVLHGSAQAPLHVHEDALGKLGFQRIRSTVTAMAAEGEQANLAGDHPIPKLLYGKLS